MSGAQVLSEADVFSHIPPKASDLHKGSAGRLLIVAGSRSFCGAAVMACMGAARCGCGYLTLAAVPFVCHLAAQRLPELTFLYLDENTEGRVKSPSPVLDSLSKYDAVLIGCGLGLDENTRRLVRQVVRRCEKPVVLDADGINAAAEDISLLQGARAPMILTPHEGEMSRLSKQSVQEIHADRPGAAVAFARRYGVCLALKGPGTLIASPDGVLLKNPTGNSGLAKAGSGDILAGMIASLAAQGIDPVWSAAAGVYLHGAAADLTAQRLSRFFMQPLDLLGALPDIFLRNGR